MEWLNCFLNYKKIFRAHALERMYQRNINFNDLKKIKKNIKIIEEYPEDKPFPSCLALGFSNSKKPIHIVFSVNEPEKTVIIITIYQPDVKKWVDNFTRRKP